MGVEMCVCVCGSEGELGVVVGRRERGEKNRGNDECGDDLFLLGNGVNNRGV